VSFYPNAKARNIQMVQTYWDEVWGKGNLQAVADFYHPKAKHGDNFTVDGFQKAVTFQREAFPDFKVTINDIFATGNKVICEVTYSGTHTGRKMFKQEPLGKAVKVPGLDIFTFENGKCVNHQHVADHLDLVLQMGIQLIPTPPDHQK
jgi:predicted ester cyclase